MTDKKTNMGKGDFIELNKDQYKKKSNYKIYLYISLIILFCFSTGAVFLGKSNLFTEHMLFNGQDNFFNNESLNDQNEIRFQEMGKYGDEHKIVEDLINQDQVNLEKNLEEFKIDIDKNRNNLENTQNTLKKVEKKLTTFIDEYKSNSDYYYSEKYIILNAILRIKAKFKKRENLEEELNILSKKFQSNFEIQNLINSLQKIDTTKISTKKKLLEFLNYKINYFDQNLENFIVERIDQQNELNFDIFSSKETFLKYLNDFVSSIVKISKIENNTSLKENDISIETHLRGSLVKTKEYLLYDDLKRSMETMVESRFDDAEIKKWINDAESLMNVKRNLEELEYILLELTGKEID